MDGTGMEINKIVSASNWKHSQCTLAFIPARGRACRSAGEVLCLLGGHIVTGTTRQRVRLVRSRVSAHRHQVTPDLDRNRSAIHRAPSSWYLANLLPPIHTTVRLTWYGALLRQTGQVRRIRWGSVRRGGACR